MKIGSKEIKKIYFVGILDTGTAITAALCRQAGYTVLGADDRPNPHFSQMLTRSDVSFLTTISGKNISDFAPDLVVIANGLDADQVEARYAIENGYAFTSFPKLLSEIFLKSKTNVVVTGTHGKSTTTGWLGHCLELLGEAPGYFIGAVPVRTGKSFEVGAGKIFVVEGDEYSSAEFDSGSKFFHYRPEVLLLNNLEYDHDDLFPDLDAIKEQFTKLIEMISDKRKIIANVSDPGVADLLAGLELTERVTRVGNGPDCDVKWRRIPGAASVCQITSPSFGSFDVAPALAGIHNAANVAMVVGALEVLTRSGRLLKTPDTAKLKSALEGYLGVRQRLEFLGTSPRGALVYFDFAHHPTAIARGIAALGELHPDRRIFLALDLKHSVFRNRWFEKDLKEVCALADGVWFRTHASLLGRRSLKMFSNDERLLNAVRAEVAAGDVIVFMSSVDFRGIPQKLTLDSIEG